MASDSEGFRCQRSNPDQVLLNLPFEVLYSDARLAIFLTKKEAASCCR